MLPHFIPPTEYKSWEVLTITIQNYLLSNNFKTVFDTASEEYKVLKEIETDPTKLQARLWNTEIIGQILAAFGVLLEKHGIELQYLHYGGADAGFKTISLASNQVASNHFITLIQHVNQQLPHFDVLLPKVTMQ